MPAATMNEDFVDFLVALQATTVDFVIVGAHALAVHGVARQTGDLDIFVRPSVENARRVFDALVAFGATLAMHGLMVEDLARPGVVYQLGLPPRRIDVLNDISGRTFEEVWAQRVEIVLGDLRLPFIGCEDLVANKRASGRPKDLLDIELLREAGVRVGE